MTGVLVPVSGSVGSAGCRFFVGMERGTPEEAGIGPGVDGVVDAVEVLWPFIFDELEIRKKENEEILKLTENHEWAEYICLGVKGNIKSDGTYTEAIKRICKRNGLPHITMHGLRHMFATILIEQSVSLEKISKLMGHKSVATTFEIYCGIMEAKKEIAKTIDSVMDPAIGAVKVRSKGGIVCM